MSKLLGHVVLIKRVAAILLILSFAFPLSECTYRGAGRDEVKRSYLLDIPGQPASDASTRTKANYSVFKWTLRSVLFSQILIAFIGVRKFSLSVLFAQVIEIAAAGLISAFIFYSIMMDEKLLFGFYLFASGQLLYIFSTIFIGVICVLQIRRNRT